MSLALVELGRKRVLSVDDWAEIRRLHRAEKMSIRAIADARGVSRNTVRKGVESGRAAAVCASAYGVVGGRGRAEDPGVVAR